MKLSLVFLGLLLTACSERYSTSFYEKHFIENREEFVELMRYQEKLQKSIRKIRLGRSRPEVSIEIWSNQGDDSQVSIAELTDETLYDLLSSLKIRRLDRASSGRVEFYFWGPYSRSKILYMFIFHDVDIERDYPMCPSKTFKSDSFESCAVLLEHEWAVGVAKIELEPFRDDWEE